MINRYASLRQGLVGAWCPSLGASGYRLIDRSGYGNHGTLTNMDPGTDWVPSGGKLALDFDGVNDYVDISNEARFDFERTNAFSASFWVKLNTLAPTAQIVLSKLNPSAPNEGWEIRFFDPANGNSNALSVIFANDVSGFNSINCLANQTGFASNTWYNIAITYSGASAATGLSMYISGVAYAKNVLNDGLSSSMLNNFPLRIGQRANGVNVFPVNGQLDDIRIWSRVLTPSEIRLLAQSRMPERATPQRTRTVFYSSGLVSYLRRRTYNSILGSGVLS